MNMYMNMFFVFGFFFRVADPADPDPADPVLNRGSTVADLGFFLLVLLLLYSSRMDKEDEVMTRPRWCRCFHSLLFSHKACSHPRKWWSVSCCLVRRQDG